MNRNHLSKAKSDPEHTLQDPRIFIMTFWEMNIWGKTRTKRLGENQARAHRCCVLPVHRKQRKKKRFSTHTPDARLYRLMCISNRFKPNAKIWPRSSGESRDRTPTMASRGQHSICPSTVACSRAWRPLHAKKASG